jgi:hypothetical protein
VLTRQAKRKKHLAALHVCELSLRSTRIESRLGGPALTSFIPILASRLIRHPGYGGDLRIRTDEPPWQTFPATSQQTHHPQ